MANFIPTKHHLREVILHYFIAEKSAAETHRLLEEIYGDHAPSKTTCKEWFRRFRNDDFNTEDKEHGKPPKKFKDAELKVLLDQDSSITQSELAAALNVDRSTVAKRLQKMGMVQKQAHSVPQTKKSITKH